VFVDVGLDLGGGQDGTLANRGLLPLNLIVVEAQSKDVSEMHMKAIERIKDIWEGHANDLDDCPRLVGGLPENLGHHGLWTK
jgi:hypothetical protein